MVCLMLKSQSSGMIFPKIIATGRKGRQKFLDSWGPIASTEPSRTPLGIIRSCLRPIPTPQVTWTLPVWFNQLFPTDPLPPSYESKNSTIFTGDFLVWWLFPLTKSGTGDSHRRPWVCSRERITRYTWIHRLTGVLSCDCSRRIPRVLGEFTKRSGRE